MAVTGWWGLTALVVVHAVWLTGMYLRLRFTARSQDSKIDAWLNLAKQRPDLKMIEETSRDGVTTRIVMGAPEGAAR
jgi:hypothetical protein